MPEEKSKSPSAPQSTRVPVLPLRDVVVYPHMVIPLFVGRDKSILALDEAMRRDKQILLVAQKAADVDDPKARDLYTVGTVATILQLLKLPDGTVKVLVEGVARAMVENMDVDGYFIADMTPLPDIEVYEEREIDVLTRSVVSHFEQYVKLNKKVPPEILTSLAGIEQPGRLADTVAAHMALKLSEKQKVLESQDVRARLEQVMSMIEGEMEVLQIEKKIRGRVKSQMEKSQREYYLNEQMKAIQKELGDLEDAPNELGDLEKRIAKAGMPKEAREKATAELNKLKLMSPMSAEATVVRNYVDWLVKVPWKKRTKVHHDIAAAQKVLDEDHFGLEKVKERIVEYLAVTQRVKRLKGPILCLVGPPGVGKTSLGQSIARATNRKFVRMSLGGVRDEAEIRGHRRTYIGSLPGKVLQNMARTGVRNPLFLFDEVDKMSMDFRGDPSSALLEVLDPEQNASFSDHYLEVDFDLSEVMFVCTANTLNIPAPLLDRMEVIRLPGYTEDEKQNIGRRFLLPKQVRQNGLKDGELTVDDPAILDIIRHYTRESGVRNLERETAKICRKAVKQLLLEPEIKKVDRDGGQPRQVPRRPPLPLWPRGGSESRRARHRPRLDRGRRRTADDRGGRRARQGQAPLHRPARRSDAGVHPGRDDRGAKPRRHRSVSRPTITRRSTCTCTCPEGATPKDGPSAGIGMCTALVSALTKIPVRASVAMTGEITLRGEVLPIGGLKEKLLAAQRGGIETVLIPSENEKDLVEIPENIKEKLDIRPVKWIDEVLEIALERSPQVTTTTAAPTAGAGREAPKEIGTPQPAAARSSRRSRIERALSRLGLVGVDAV